VLEGAVAPSSSLSSEDQPVTPNAMQWQDHESTGGICARSTKCIDGGQHSSTLQRNVFRPIVVCHNTIQIRGGVAAAAFVSTSPGTWQDGKLTDL
jgi:hypothetical protein